MLENKSVTLEGLIRDNYSEAAGQNIERIHSIRTKGQLTVVWGCSDARLILPDDVYQVRTIAGTGPRSSWASLLNYEKTQGTLVMDHLYCGGIQARAGLPEKIDEDSVAQFVMEHVWADDPIVQSILTGSWTASRTQRSVMSAIQNPMDGSVYPQGVFNNGSQTEHKTIPTYKLMPDRYVPEKIYGDEIPQLNQSLIPESFVRVLKAISEKVSRIKSTKPDIFENQPIQNPEVVAITTNLKPLSARFPELFGNPNTVFQVSLKRQQLDEEVETRDIAEAFRQVNYPISQSVDNSRQDALAPFRSTRVLYLETGDMRVSMRLARQAIRRRWIQEWLKLPDRTIVAAEAIKGKIQQIKKVV